VLNLHKLALVSMFVHDIGDIFLYWGKFTRVSDSMSKSMSMLTDFFFGTFLIQFTFWRLMFWPATVVWVYARDLRSIKPLLHKIASSVFGVELGEMPWNLPVWEVQTGRYIVTWVFGTNLVLQSMWFCLLMKAVWRMFRPYFYGGKRLNMRQQRDLREEDLTDTEDEEEMHELGLTKEELKARKYGKRAETAADREASTLKEAIRKRKPSADAADAGAQPTESESDESPKLAIENEVKGAGQKKKKR